MRDIVTPAVAIELANTVSKGCKRGGDEKALCQGFLHASVGHYKIYHVLEVAISYHQFREFFKCIYMYSGVDRKRLSPSFRKSKSRCGWGEGGRGRRGKMKGDKTQALKDAHV